MSARRRNRAPLRPAVRRVVGMEIASGIGDGVFWVGLAAYLIEAGVGPSGFAIAALARFGPRAIVGAPAGVLADRLDRRRMLVALDLARGTLMIVLAALATADVDYRFLLLVVVTSYTLAAPYRPALTAGLPLVAGEEQLSAANAMVGTTRQVMTFVGPVLGTIVVTLSSPAAAFAVNASSFAAAGALVSSVAQLGGRPRRRTVGLEGHRAQWSADAEIGWHEVRATMGLRVISLLVFAMYVARGAEVVLLVFLAEDRLGLGTAGIGVLSGAVGLGAIVALPAASRVADSGRPQVVLTASVLSTGVPLLALAHVRSPAMASAILVVVGSGIVVFEALSVVLLQRLARRAVLGRVFGVVGAVSSLAKLVGALAAPLLVASAGLAGAFAAAGAVIVATAVAAYPALRALANTVDERRERLRPIVEAFAGLGLFDGASIGALERIASAAELRSVPAGTVVLRQGEPADDLYVIRSGDFAVTDGDAVINTMGDGDWFGEIGLVQRRARTATVITTTGAEMWRIPGETFLAELESNAQAPDALFDVMAGRLARSGLR